MTEYRVIGPFEVDGKSKGEIVKLDPQTVNIQALIEGGHVEPVAKRTVEKRES